MDEDVSYHNQFATENSPRKMLQEIKKVAAMPNPKSEVLDEEFLPKEICSPP